jgi:DNA helicase HerA-like ATPase
MEDLIKKFESIDIFQDARNEDYYAGRPFSLDYDNARLLVADDWKMNVGGIPQGTFLLAFYENEKDVSEALLLRALKPTPLPTEISIISSMIEYYKDDLQTAGENSNLDDFTRYEFSFSGLECSILGTFYKDNNDKLIFGADVENFYSPHNYRVFKPVGDILELIVNLREGESSKERETDVKIGNVRYSSTERFQNSQDKVSVYINPKDFLGKRTALFGMTRTGKSNTVKKIIESSMSISRTAENNLNNSDHNLEDNLDAFEETGVPKYPVGQIIFDINGEYANANLQDEGTAIFELFKEDVIRYSTEKKEGFEVLKVNFYKDIPGGFALAKDFLKDVKDDYVNNFKAVDLSEPEDMSIISEKTRYERRIAAYLCCLKKAQFKVPEGFETVTFKGNKDLNKLVQEEGKIDPSEGITLEEAYNWFTEVWKNGKAEFEKYRNKHGHDWADEGLKALLVFLTQRFEGRQDVHLSGFRKLSGLEEYHTTENKNPFDKEIISALRLGKIVIIDLSQGSPEIQYLYSERLCETIFNDSMNRFTKNKPNNFIQFYFEEAHNLFPHIDDKNLSQIYNRIAKEGAKLNLGLIYATQEVSSISSNILKNTQNWFISHLNNDDELKELKKYYDFKDFIKSLVRFSQNTDKGFVRMKTYSNPFVVPVQIDSFTTKER